LAILPNDDDQEPATDKQTYAIWRIGFQWFMPLSIHKLVQDKDMAKLTKRQASTVIDRLKRIEKDVQDADDIDNAADPLDVQTVEIILNALPNTEPIE